LIFRHFEPSSIPSRTTLLIVTPAFLSRPISYTVRSPVAALLFAFAAYWLGLAFFTLAYRLSPFHPLAKYPGPLIARTSKWWAAYLSGTGDQHRCFKRLHGRYGDVIRIGWNLHPPFDISTYPLPGPNELSIRDASFIHTVLGPGGLPKGPRAYMSCSIHRLTGRFAMFRLGRAAWNPFPDCSARPREAHAATQTMESSIFVHSIEGIRSHYG
jgi:hypothetical protein